MIEAQSSPPATTYHAVQSWTVSGAAVVGGSMMYANISDIEVAAMTIVGIEQRIVCAAITRQRMLDEQYGLAGTELAG